MPDATTRTNRRGLLAAAVTATAAVAASRALSPQKGEAADDDPIIIGSAKTAQSTTFLYPGFNDHGFLVWNSSSGGIATALTALMGGGDILPFPASPKNAAVFALNNYGGGAGVMAVATKQFGIGVHARGTAFNTTALFAESTAGSSAAIEAKNVSGPAILSTGEHYGLQAGALNQFGIGVQGFGPAKGVEGFSSAAGGIGVSAQSTDGTALKVIGTNAFSQAGKGTVPAGKRNVGVSGLKVTSDSGVLVTLNTAPPPDVRVDFVRIVPPGRIVVILNKKTTKPITFTYFVLEKATP